MRLLAYTKAVPLRKVLPPADETLVPELDELDLLTRLLPPEPLVPRPVELALIAGGAS